MSLARPHILYLVTSSAWGGAERYVVRLAKEAARAFEVTVAAGTSKRFELFNALPAGVRRVEIPELKRRIAPTHDLRAIAAVRRLIDREQVDLVHANSTKAGLVGALAAATSRRKPKSVFTAHGWAFMEKRSLPYRLAVLWSDRLAARFRDLTIVLSALERDAALRERTAPEGRLRLVPLGLDAGEIALLGREAARAELARLCGRERLPEFVFGALSNAYPPKGLPILIEAFGRLEGSDALVICGDGPDMDKVRHACALSPARDRIFLPGAVKDAARLLKGFDVFVLPSLKEGLPWAMLEAAAAGVPIVATRVGAIPEAFRDGREALLVEPGDAAALSAAMAKLRGDDGLRAMLAKNAPQAAARRSAKDMLDATFGIYHELLRDPIA